VDTDVTIRTERPEDRPEIERVVSTAFGSDAEAELVERIRASPEYIPELAMVAVSDGSIVGHVMISGATLRTGDGDRPTVMLSPLAVSPDRRRGGVGGALVRRVTEHAARLGWPFVVLEGDPAYYGRFGFVAAQTFGISLPLPDWAGPAAAQILVLSDGVVPPPGRVIYPVAFDGVE
jgi:putative acetyltransferase